jgi:hypothetical protein
MIPMSNPSQSSKTRLLLDDSDNSIHASAPPDITFPKRFFCVQVSTTAEVIWHASPSECK